MESNNTNLTTRHFGLEDLRSAVESIRRPPESKIDQGSPVNSPGMGESLDAKVN
jgi:hypothetical protein